MVAVLLLLPVCSLLAAPAPASASITPDTFIDYTSVRRYFSGAVPKVRAAPWDTVNLTGIAQLEPRGDGSVDQAWVLEEGTGRVWLLSVGGVLQVVTVDGSALAVAPGESRLVVSSGEGVPPLLVIAQPAKVLWLKCATGTASCHQMALAGSTLGAINSAAMCGAQLWLGTASGLARSGGVGLAPQLLPVTRGQAVLAVTTATATGSIAAATAQTLWTLERGANEVWRHLGVGGVIDSNITALSFFSGGLAVGTAHALHVVDANGVVARFSGLQGLPVAGTISLRSGLSSDSSAALYIGTTEGMISMAKGAADCTSLASGGKPDWRYFNGDRWLVSAGGSDLNSAVTAMAVLHPLRHNRSTSASSAAMPTVLLVATATGVATIEARVISLEQKVAHFQSMISPQHDRYGWTAQVPLVKHGDRASYALTDGDNDGSNTAYYMASQIFRFKVTNSSEARANSWRAFAAMEFLHNVTRPFAKRPGFVARTAVRCGEAHQGPSGGVCHLQKGQCAPTINASCAGCSPPAGSCVGFACPGWANSSECYSGMDDHPADTTNKQCCWSFKSDTSTDETDGHFYGLQLAYDHLATTEREKVRAARLLCDMTSYIVDHGFLYIDPLTGNRTTWGYWSPAVLNGVGVGSSSGVGDNGKPNERGLNSLEILSYLAAAHKICGAHTTATPPLRQPANGSYAEALASLVLDHGYGENILNVHLSNPGYDNQGIAWFDFGNSFYTFYSFAAAAPWDPSRRGSGKLPARLTQAVLTKLESQFHAGFEAFWQARSYSASAERTGLWSEIYRSVTGKHGNPDPLWVVRRGANQQINWGVRNSQRLDIQLRRDWLDCCNASLAVEPLPPDESPDMHFEDDSPYPLDGGDAEYEAAPVVYLETYWLHRFNEVQSE